MYLYRQLTQADLVFSLPQMWSLIVEEKQNIDSRLKTSTLDFYEQFFSEQGLIWSAWQQDRLVGFALLGYNNLVPEFWLSYLEALSVNKSNCAAFRSVLVTKSLRGQGIGSTLFALRLLSAQEKGIEVVFGTVAPDNFDSLRLFLKHGFQEIERRQIFDFTSLRILMYKSIVQMIVPQASESENNLFAKNKISDLNVARMGKFSSDRAIAQYCNDIWQTKAVPIQLEAYSQINALLQIISK